MRRRRYLVSYDISDPVRLRRVHRVMLGYGYWLQYSVFVCDLDLRERAEMLAALAEVMHLHADSVAIVDLGDPATSGTRCFSFLGKVKHLPRQGPRVV